jgi:hypothetical protein
VKGIPTKRRGFRREGGSRSKSYGFGTGWFSPAPAYRCRCRWFPIIGAFGALPLPRPDCHLVRTAILRLPRRFTRDGQPRCFPRQSCRLLASFAENISRGIRAARHGHWLAVCDPLSASPTQGRLLRAQRPAALGRRVSHRDAGLIPLRTPIAKNASKHRYRSPHGQGRVPHAIGERPDRTSAPNARFPPAPAPNWAFKAWHKGIHRCALQRIFRPFLLDGRSD